MNLKNFFLKHCEDNDYEINRNQLDIINYLKKYYEENFNQGLLYKIFRIKKNKLGFYLSGNGFIFDIISKECRMDIKIKNFEMIIDLKHKNSVKTLQILNENEKKKLISIGRKNTIKFLNNYFFIFNFN